MIFSLVQTLSHFLGVKETARLKNDLLLYHRDLKTLYKVYISAPNHTIIIRIKCTNKDHQLDKKRLASIPVAQNYSCYFEFKENAQAEETLDFIGGPILPLLSSPGFDIVRVDME
jgi:hypothetical protein